MLYLLCIFLAAFLGAWCGATVTVRDLRDLALLPLLLWDAMRGELPTEADVDRERAKLEAMVLAQRGR